MLANHNKNIKMRKICLVLFCVFCSLNIEAQENSFKIQSAGIGFGAFHIKNDITDGGGASFIADVTSSFGKNLISASFLTGSEVASVGSSTFNFNEFRLQYGRELEAKSWLKFEFFAGVGYYDQKSETIYFEQGNAVSFPLTFNTKFYLTEKFGLGINTNYSLNSINNNVSAHLTAHYKFN